MPDICKTATSPNKNRPRVDIVREVRHNYNHKPPKKSRKKTTSRPAGPAPDPAPPRRFLQRGRTTKTRPKSTAETPPKTHPKTTPKTTAKTHLKTTPKTTARTPPDIRRTTTRRHPKTRPAFLLGPDWVRPGSGLGPHLILWKLYHIPLHFPNHRDTFQPNRSPPQFYKRTQQNTPGPNTDPAPAPPRNPRFYWPPQLPLLFLYKRSIKREKERGEREHI